MFVASMLSVTTAAHLCFFMAVVCSCTYLLNKRWFLYFPLSYVNLLSINVVIDVRVSGYRNERTLVHLHVGRQLYTADVIARMEVSNGIYRWYKSGHPFKFECVSNRLAFAVAISLLFSAQMRM